MARVMSLDWSAILLPSASCARVVWGVLVPPLGRVVESYLWNEQSVSVCRVEVCFPYIKVQQEVSDLEYLEIIKKQLAACRDFAHIKHRILKMLYPYDYKPTSIYDFYLVHQIYEAGGSHRMLLKFFENKL